MHTSIGIRIAAPPEAVHALARDVERWQHLLPHYRRSTVHARKGPRVLSTMRAVRAFGAMPVPVTWRAICWPDASDPDDLRLEFRHVRGVTRGMAVTWHIRPVNDGRASDVQIVHEFSRTIPLLGSELLPGLIDRWFTQPIAGRTLAAFRDLAEAAPPNHTA
jgi:aromatase